MGAAIAHMNAFKNNKIWIYIISNIKIHIFDHHALCDARTKTQKTLITFSKESQHHSASYLCLLKLIPDDLQPTKVTFLHTFMSFNFRHSAHTPHQIHNQKQSPARPQRFSLDLILLGINFILFALRFFLTPTNKLIQKKNMNKAAAIAASKNIIQNENILYCRNAHFEDNFHIAIDGEICARWYMN